MAYILSTKHSSNDMDRYDISTIHLNELGWSNAWASKIPPKEKDVPW